MPRALRISSTASCNAPPASSRKPESGPNRWSYRSSRRLYLAYRRRVVLVEPADIGERSVTIAGHQFVARLLFRPVRQMEARAIGGAHLLQPRGARLARTLVAFEGTRHIIGHRIEERRQCRAVLDRLRGAL